MRSMTRRQFMVFSLQLAVAAKLAGCSSAPPVLGRNPLAKPFVMEDHSQALAHWAERGVRDAVLMNIDTHDDFRWIPHEKIAALEGLYRQRDWRRFRAADSLGDESLYHIGNWIYAGARLGIFSEIYWVIPFRYFPREDAEAQLQQLLTACRFKAEDIQTFRLRDRQFVGSFRGIPVTICGLESLPAIDRPLLLSFDVDFFPTYSQQYRESYLTALHNVFDALDARDYRIRDAIVCSSVNGDYYLPPHLRWVADAVTMILVRPQLLRQSPPEQLLLLQQLDTAYRTTDAAAMLQLLEQYLDRYPLPPLLLYKAYAHLLEHEFPPALAAAESCCRQDKRYCPALPYIGIICYEKGLYREAEKFFRAGFVADPAMRTGLFQFGHCLRKLGRLQEALDVYERDARLNGSFPTRFLIAETCLAAGDSRGAGSALTAAIESMEREPYAEFVSRTEAEALYALLDFCDRRGLAGEAALLRGHPAVVEMMRRFPQYGS
ncbi:hypothetical protein GURASL_32410 [Geotalea uraniireducens]|uniref:Tetratricopeptide repeat protein n=1 Tax=Geotalea uraniireducens TaxID=351604 RepID=A0ABN6VVC4_9BACT|nr:hypothetical protein [Geotalea uraniireducens]BDV44318.1 hypothetical protein GURASL_32410 [Geotalea uraniireducens]